MILAALPSPAPPGLMENPYECLSVRVLRAPTHCPALRQGLQPYAHLSWGLHRTCTSPQGIWGLNDLRNAVTSLFFFFKNFIFSLLLVIKVQGRVASLLMDVCFDSWCALLKNLQCTETGVTACQRATYLVLAASQSDIQAITPARDDNWEMCLFCLQESLLF